MINPNARAPWNLEYIRDQYVDPFIPFFGLSQAFVDAWDSDYPLCNSLSI